MSAQMDLFGPYETLAHFDASDVALYQICSCEPEVLETLNERELAVVREIAVYECDRDLVSVISDLEWLNAA